MMKRINLFVALVATLCFACSCSSEEKPMITLYEVENGDTIEVKHEITPSEIQEWLIDGYQFKENREALILKYTNKDEIPSVFELVAFLSSFDDIKVEENKIKDLKELVQTINRPVEAQVFIYNNDDKICIYSIDKENPQISFGVCVKRDGFNEYCKKMKEVEKFSDYNDTELQYISMLALLTHSESTPFYFTARNFESKSGIISRLVTACAPQ